MNGCRFECILGDPFIMAILAQYITTADFLVIASSYRCYRDNLNAIWGDLKKAVPVQPRYAYISNTFLRDSFFHFVCSSIEESIAVLNGLASSETIILNMRFSVDNIPNFREFVDSLIGAGQFSNLSEQVMVTQFTFGSDTGQVDAEYIGYSNSVPVPGGTLRLFKKPVTGLYPGSPGDGACHVVGIDLDTPKLWLCRVASVGNARLDLKAGTMRSDVLRVPNGSKRGTWTDLCPVSGTSAITNPENVYIVEYMMNSSM